MIIRIPEFVVKEGAEACKDDENNSFLKALNAASEFKEADMTPIFLIDDRFRDLFVVAEETFQKKLH